ncbi:MAG: hypothetical protein D6785_04035 [Planctomycetota bacterium]|nr:MAG: hypothetical protein D6785_04035 [Planctomycetota bacterium]
MCQKNFVREVFNFLFLDLLFFSVIWGFWGLQGCVTSPPPPKKEKTFRNLKEVARQASKTITQKIQEIAAQGRIAVLPLVDKKGVPCHLGKEIATQIAKNLNIHPAFSANLIFFEDINYQNYPLAAYLGYDFVIAGKMDLDYRVHVNLEICSLEKKGIFRLQPYYLAVTDYFRKLYFLHLQKPSKSGLVFQEGCKLALDIIDKKLKKNSSLRRMVVFRHKNPFLRKLGECLFQHFSKPENFGNRCLFPLDKKKIPRLKEGKEVWIEMVIQPFGEDRYLVFFFLAYPGEVSKEHFTLLFYKGEN